MNVEDCGAGEDGDGDEYPAGIGRSPPLDIEVGLSLGRDVHQVLEPIVTAVVRAREAFNGVR